MGSETLPHRLAELVGNHVQRRHTQPSPFYSIPYQSTFYCASRDIHLSATTELCYNHHQQKPRTFDSRGVSFPQFENRELHEHISKHTTRTTKRLKRATTAGSLTNQPTHRGFHPVLHARKKIMNWFQDLLRILCSKRS